ncbi:hypothetical protein DH86_00002337, partial [Scytalidium sp. 3C]
MAGNNNNVEQALNEYFDNTESTQIPQYGHFDTAPSRPPSRTSNNKSPLSKAVDLTSEHVAANSRTSLTQNDRDLEQALAASRAEAGLPPQESGVIGTDQVYFGPATRTQYEEGKWDMVPIGKSSVQEILFDPEPTERKREIDAPAFLKPAVEDHRLAALLTIYHEIPLAREIFLDRMDVSPSYGFNQEWWSGTEIQMASVDTEGEGR